MPRYVDLSHVFENEMPGFRLVKDDGTVAELSASVRPFVSHEESSKWFGKQAGFEITEVHFQTSVGTYIDAPYHRYPKGRDFTEVAVGELVAEGLVVDARGLKSGQAAGPEILPEPELLRGKAVLFRFGWDRHWASERYYGYPFISRGILNALVKAQVKMVGVDTINIDDHRDLGRPAHTRLLKRDIFIIENLRNLGALGDCAFRFFAVPIKGRKMAAIPVRAFAEILD